MKVRFSILTVLAVATIAAAGCQTAGDYNLPPAERLMHPGPGVTGPGPGVLPPVRQASVMMPGHHGAAMAMMPGGIGVQMAAAQQPVSQILFVNPVGMHIRWDISGIGQYDSTPLIAPGRHNFPQGGIYRLKLTHIRAREGIELYPTIEVGPTTPRTEAFLAHNAIPVQLTEEDFDQVLSGNFVTKVIYLPDPEFQELALAGVETLVSTRLDPGQDPITVADRRGAILAIIRIGNIDPELPAAENGNGEQSVLPISYGAAGHAPMGFGGAPGAMPPITLPPPHVAGVTTPTFGMPMSGTPIGLAGPPHVPLGTPAGLRKHVMRNHTRMQLPEPTKKLRIDVKQRPGMNYPKPVNRVRIVEQTINPAPPYNQPMGDARQFIP